MVLQGLVSNTHMTPEQISDIRRKFGLAEPETELSQRGTPLTEIESKRRVNSDFVKRQIAKSNAEIKAYDEMVPHEQNIKAKQMLIDDINKKARKANVNRGQYYDGRYREYSTVEPIYDEAEQVKMSALKKGIIDSKVAISKIREKVGKIARSVPNKAMGVAGDALFTEKYANADAYDESGGLYRSWDLTNIDGQAFTTESVQGMMDRAAMAEAEWQKNREFNMEQALLRETVRDNPKLIEAFRNRYLK